MPICGAMSAHKTHRCTQTNSYACTSRRQANKKDMEGDCFSPLSHTGTRDERIKKRGIERQREISHISIIELQCQGIPSLLQEFIVDTWVAQVMSGSCDQCRHQVQWLQFLQHSRLSEDGKEGLRHIRTMIWGQHTDDKGQSWCEHASQKGERGFVNSREKMCPV